MGIAKSSLRAFCCGILGLFVICVIRMITFPSKQPAVKSCDPRDDDFIPLTDERISHFQDAIKLKTISHGLNQTDVAEVEKLHQLLERLYPNVHRSPLVQKEVVGKYSLLFTVYGSDPALRPYMLTAHMDVVPTEGQNWDHSPFGGKIVDGYLYGRGTIDDKNGVIGIMEALEFRLQRGFKPVRTLYIGFGHDEEVLGVNGAGNIAKVLKERKVRLEFLLDEGTFVLKGAVPMVDKPIACISVTEKGAVSLNISMNDISTGHSSMPPKETNIGVLAKALLRIEENRFPSMFGLGQEKDLFEALANEFPLPIKFLTTNLWLFGSLFGWFLGLSPSTNAIVRTTTAVTMIHGGVKANVLAPSAWFVVNHRIHPAQTVDEVIEYDRRLIGDKRIKIEELERIDVAPISRYGDGVFGYQAVIRSIKQVMPDVLIAPGLMIGNTDTRFYHNFTNQVFRFAPTLMHQSDLPRFHGINERISLKNFEETINFYFHLMENADKTSFQKEHTHTNEL